jgi:hypothetical protein
MTTVIMITSILSVTLTIHKWKDESIEHDPNTFRDVKSTRLIGPIKTLAHSVSALGSAGSPTSGLMQASWVASRSKTIPTVVHQKQHPASRNMSPSHEA